MTAFSDLVLSRHLSLQITSHSEGKWSLILHYQKRYWTIPEIWSSPNPPSPTEVLSAQFKLADLDEAEDRGWWLSKQTASHRLAKLLGQDYELFAKAHHNSPSK